LYQGGARFEDVEHAAACAFAVVRLLSRSGVEHRFCVQFSLQWDEEAADERDTAVHAQVLSGIDPRTLILNVLHGLPAGSGVTRVTGAGRTPGMHSWDLLTDATIERVMEACTADESRIEEIDAVLKVYKSAPALVDFSIFWQEFKTALREGHRA
jgi:hypothetical protein